MNPQTPRERLLRKPEFQAIVGLSDASVWRLEKSGQFPRRIQLGGNSVAWLETEILAWIQSKADARSGINKTSQS